MSKSKLLQLLMAVCFAAFLSACGGGGGSNDATEPATDPTEPATQPPTQPPTQPATDPTEPPTDPAADPVTLADFEVYLAGPGGHSEGNYGRTNALHAAGRAMAELKKTTFKFYLKAFYGGNSVNSIASDGRFIVGLVEGDATAFEAALHTAVDAGVAAENAHRGVVHGDITGGVPADIRVQDFKKL